jgi:hypothetical protein
MHFDSSDSSSMTTDAIGTDPGAAASRTEPLAPRLRMRSATERGGFVDGGWWPRSTELGVELPPLLSVLFAEGYQVHRVSYNLVGWQSPPRLTVEGFVVRLGGFRGQSRHSMSLLDNSSNSAVVSRLEIVIVPPETDAVIAERILLLAGRDGGRLRAAEIVEQANLKRPAR